MVYIKEELLHKYDIDYSDYIVLYKMCEYAINDPTGLYRGGSSYLANIVKESVRGTDKRLQRLVKKGFIEKRNPLNITKKSFFVMSFIKEEMGFVDIVPQNKTVYDLNSYSGLTFCLCKSKSIPKYGNPMNDIGCVYLLANGVDVVYIGITNSNHYRPWEHKDKSFNAVYFAWTCTYKEVEVMLIRYAKPIYNIKGV